MVACSLTVDRAWWCSRHWKAVELHELVLCALARKVSRATRLRVVEAISRRLETLDRQQLRAAHRRIQCEREALENDCGCIA